MSQEKNVKVVRRICESTDGRDTGTALSLYHADVECEMAHHPRGKMFDVGGSRLGQGLRAWFREWYEAFGDIEHVSDELTDAGECVISIGSDRGRGRESGVEVEPPCGAWMVREGKVVRVEWFVTRDGALEALGLSE